VFFLVVEPLRGGGGVNPLTTKPIFFFFIKSGCFSPITWGEKNDKIRFKIFKTKKKKMAWTTKPLGGGGGAKP